MKNVEKLVKILIEKNMKISFAESCTGGMLASSIVDVADASKVLDASFVTYANEAKIKYAGVKLETLDNYGAVSEQVAGEMAQGVAQTAGADIGVGVSGIAGPGGGTKEKPVGMVCFGYCVDGNVVTETVQWGDQGRDKVRTLSTEYVINKLIEFLED